MTRITKTAPAAVWLAGVLVAGVGCVSTDSTTDRPGIQARYSNLVDTAYPERYAYHSRREVLAPFAIQANNGHIIDQTVYSYHFEPETDKLTQGGRDKLDVIKHRRPTPDPKVYLQTTKDLTYDPAKPEAFVAARQDMDQKRAVAILKYLAVQTIDRQAGGFEVQVIDPGDILVPAEWRAPPVRGLARQFQSTLGAIAGGTGGGGQSTSGGGAGTGAGPSGAGGGPAPTPSPSN